MSTPIGFERWEPGAPWGDVVYADGTRTSVHDPDGAIEADARQYGARYNAQPKPAPPPAPEPALSGAASPPLPPSTPTVPSGPPLPSGSPLTAAERAPLEPPAQDVAQIQSGLAAQPASPAASPSTQQSPAAQALADHGINPGSLPRQGAPAAAPAAGPDPLSPAFQAVQQHAPGLVASGGKVGYEGPDQETRQAVQAASDQALTARGKAITEQTQAKGMGIQTDASQAVQAYYAGWQQQMQAHGQLAAAQAARDEAAAKLNTVKQTPIKDHPDFPEWFTVSSILGSIAGGFAEGFSGGRYKSTTLPMIQQIIGDWRETQKYNRGQLIESLTSQLGDRDAALNAAGARLKEGIAAMAEGQARFARTPAAMAELKATADSLRAQALDDWAKTQTTVMGKTSESLSLAAPKPGLAGNDVLRRLAALGVDAKAWKEALGSPLQTGQQNPPTLGQAAQAIKRIDADRSLLTSIAAANGGTLPTRGNINIPQALVGALSRLGYKPGMQAEEVGQLLGGYVMQRARSYGGAVTESDAAAAEKETGKSTEGVMRYLDRLRSQNNRAMSTEMARFFPGVEQQVLDILLERSSEGITPGIPEPPTTPFEKQNATEAEGQAAETKQRAAEREKYLTDLEKTDPERARIERENRERMPEQPVKTAEETFGKQKPRDSGGKL